MSVGIIILLILALLLVIFTLQNSVLISLKLFIWELSDVPLVLALIVTLILGFLVAGSIYYPKIWKLKSKIKEQQKLINEKEMIDQEGIHPEGIEISGGSDKGFFNDQD